MKRNIKGAADFVDTSGTSPKQHQRRSNRIDRLAKAGKFEAMARKINRWYPGESSSKQLATVKEGAAQGAYENPEIIQDADGAMAGANALSGINEAIQIQSLKKPENKDETDTGEGDTEGAAQTRTTTNDLAKNMHLRFGIRGRESIEEGASTLTQNALSNPEVYNMTPNVSEEDAKEVREKNERTYLKSSLADGIVEGTVTRFIKSGSPRMVNKLRNIK